MKMPPARSALARCFPSGEKSRLVIKSACFFMLQTTGEAGEVEAADDLLRVFFLRGPNWEVFAALDAVGDAGSVDEVER